MEVLLLLTVILFFSFLTETLVEFVFETAGHWIAAAIPKAEPILFPIDKSTHLRTGIIQAAAIAVGIAGAVLYQFDLLKLLADFLVPGADPANMMQTTTLSLVITGIAIGKGSNYLHDAIGKFFKKPEGAT